ncbi:MAG: dihydroorotate dehydrogenase electron transfer subunit [Clostridia bacterium]|nr:dihydroorotate dehydrogenase electron transfer subunit [Clostridia bacterium]
MKVNCKAEIVKIEKLKEDLYKFSIQAEEIVSCAKPGQFIDVRVVDGIEPLLRRPISIYNLDKENGILEFIFQVKGKGTSLLAQRKVGEKLDIIGPLGYGTFSIKDYKNVAIIGGGIGMFPLYELAKELKEKTTSNVHIYMGFRNKDLVTLEEEFKNVSDELTITTDDGSYGISGFAINELKKDCEKEVPDKIFACGPLPMLKAVQAFAAQNNIPCEISLEEKMACGLGVCLGCAVKTAKSPSDAPEYWHVCKAGPVFNATDVEI